MPTPRIAASSYSNTAPLIWSFLYGTNRGKFELILDNAPARSAELLANSRIDAALVPVIEYQRIDNVLLIPGVCVGAKELVRSVCLVTKGQDLKDVKSVALDISSKTSVALTKIIFPEFFGVRPIYRQAKPNLTEMLVDSDCALLIGDPALMVADLEFRISDSQDSHAQNQRTKTKNQFRKFDLVEIWREFTGFGFVFAMWMANAEKAVTAREINFAAIRDEGLAHLEEIISNYETEINLPRADFQKYLSESISYSIDNSMQKGMDLYFKLAHQNGLLASRKKLDFI